MPRRHSKQKTQSKSDKDVNNTIRINDPKTPLPRYEHEKTIIIGKKCGPSELFVNGSKNTIEYMAHNGIIIVIGNNNTITIRGNDCQILIAGQHNALIFSGHNGKIGIDNNNTIRSITGNNCKILQRGMTVMTNCIAENTKIYSISSILTGVNATVALNINVICSSMISAQQRS